MSLKTVFAAMVVFFASNQALALIGHTTEWTCVHNSSTRRVRAELQKFKPTNGNPPIFTNLAVQIGGKLLGLVQVVEGTDPNGNFEFIEKGRTSSNGLTLYVRPKVDSNNSREGQLRIPGQPNLVVTCHASTFTICGVAKVKVNAGVTSYSLLNAPFHTNNPNGTPFAKLLEEYPATEAVAGVLKDVKDGRVYCLESLDFKMEEPTTLRVMSILK